MKLFKRVFAALLATVIFIAGFPAESYIAFAAEEKQTIQKINNGYIEYSIDSSNGAFGIRTLTGHPQKSKDDNKILLYEGEGTETSFTSIRINDEDYIFGQDYSYFGIESKLDKAILNEVENSISITYHIKGIAVTQKVMISDDPDNALAGNAGVYYSIVNESSEVKKVGLRTLLDEAIGDNDAPMLVGDTQQKPMKTEQELTGEAIPSQLRGMNSTQNPTQMSYLFLDGWDNTGKAKPDKVILGHWANMANTRYDYVPDKNCDFSNYSNVYRTPDSAVSLYWSVQDIQPKASRTAEFLYGIGNFSDQLKNQPMNINITVDKVAVKEDQTGYENDGVFDVTVEIDNTVDNAQTILSPIVKLSVEEGLQIQDDEDTATLENINKGETKVLHWKLKADSQKKISAKEISVLLSTGDSAVSANRYVILPSISGKLPSVTFTKVTPDKYYSQGEKNITITGEMGELMDPLRRKSGWDIKLLHKQTKEEITIDKANTAFVENGKRLSLSTEEELAVGEWEIVFVFKDEDLVKAFGNEIHVPNTINVSDDKSLLNRSYGILGIERYDNDQYRWICFETEKDLADYRNKNALNDKDSNDREMLMEIRGKVQEFRTPQGDVYYAADPNSDNGIVLNNTTQYSKGDPLVIKQTEKGIVISGKGRLSVVNNMTFWNSSFEIAFENGKIKSLNEEKVNGESERVRINYLGIGEILQNLGGFAINLKYGEFIELWEDDVRKGNAMDFGGRIALSFMKSQKKPNTTISGVTPPEGAVPGGDKVNDSRYQLSAAIDSVLFGEKQNGVGFLGINSTVQVGLPENAMGGFVENPPLEASLTINTIDDIYELSLGVNVFVVSCSGTLRVKVEEIAGVKIPIPDKFELSAEGESAAGIPIVPGVLSLTGLKGGYDNLASTLTGKFTDGLPDLTLMLGAKLNLVGALDGAFSMEIGLKGMKLDGGLSISAIEGVSITGGMEAKWIDPFRIHAYGEINVLDVITGGVSMSITNDYFYGYGHLTLKVPGYVPIVGDMKLAEVEGAISTEFVGANVKVLFISMGVAYYWDSEKVKFGDSIDLSESQLQKGRNAFYTTEGTYKAKDKSERTYQAAYGTNFKKLDVEQGTTGAVKKKGRSATTGFDERYSTSFKLNAAGQDALLLEVPYEGSGTPDAENMKFTIDGNVVPLILDTSLTNVKNPEQGNYLLQEREGKKYIYLTVTDKKYLIDKEQTFTLATSSDKIDLEQIGVNSVMNIPEIEEIKMGEISKDKDMEVSWSLMKEGQRSKNAKINLYMTDDKDLVERLRKNEITNNDDLGISLGSYDATDKKANVKVPEAMNSGEYYIIGTLEVKDAGSNIIVSNESRTFTNDTLPSPVKKASLENAGDGRLRLKVEDIEDIDYTNYAIRLLDENDKEIENSIAHYEVGSDMILGGTGKVNLISGKTYKAEVTTVKQLESEARAYSDDAVTTEAITLAEINAPKLVKMENNINGNGDIISTNEVEITYTFDQPVYLQVLANQVLVKSTEEKAYKKEWTFKHTFEDGEQVVTIQAENEKGDTYQGGDGEDSAVGFTVDTTAPQLAIGQDVLDSTQDTKMAVSGQTINVVDGKYEVKGITEKGATLKLIDDTANIEVEEDGTFVISGKMDMTNKLNDTRRLEAVDKAGNKSDAQLYFINGDVKTFDSLKIMIKGKNGLTEPEKGEQGFGEIRLETGDALQMVPVATYTDDKGKTHTFELAPDAVEWSTTGTASVGDFKQGTYQPLNPGTLCVGASLSAGKFVVETDDRYAQIEDMVQVYTAGEEVNFVNVPEVRLTANTTTIAKQQLIQVTPVMPEHESVKKVEVSKDHNNVFEDITSSYKEGYIAKESGTYTFRITSSTGVVSDITDSYATITFTNIDPQAPELQVNSGDYEAGTWTNKDVQVLLQNMNSANLGTTSFYYAIGKNPSADDWTVINGGAFNVTRDTNEVYSFKAISQSGIESNVQTIKIQIDKTAPTGSIKVVNNVFKDTLRWLSNDYFFDKPVEVTIDGEDEGSGIATIEYLVSDRVLTKDELNQQTFTTYKKFSLGIDENVMVYAKITDNLGHTSIIKTEGLIIDGKTPELDVSSSVDMSETYSGKEVEFVVDVSDELAGINTVTYTTDEPQPQSGTVELDENGTGTIVMKNNGKYQLMISAYDNTLLGTDEGYNSGNPITKTMQVKMDTIEPSFEINMPEYDATTWVEGPIKTEIVRNSIHISGETLEIFKDGSSIGLNEASTFEITENGTYKFVMTSGSGLTATKEIVIDHIDQSKPNKPEITNKDQYTGTWFEDEQTVNVSFTKTEGCEEWLEVSEDGVNFVRMDEGTYNAKRFGSNRYFFRTVDALGRASEIESVIINIGQDPSIVPGVETGDHTQQGMILFTTILLGSFVLVGYRRKRRTSRS